MTTMTDVTDDSAAAGTAPQQQSGTSGEPPLGADPRSASSHSTAAQRRSLLVPVLSTAVGALIAGMFVLAAVGFSALRGDISTLRDDIKAVDARLGGQIADLDARLGGQIADLDAKTGGQIADLDARLGGQIADLDAKTGGQIADLDAKIDDRFDALDAKIDTEIGMLRDDMNEGFAQVNAILLDHTERLARLEAVHGIPHSHSALPQGTEES